MNVNVNPTDALVRSKPAPHVVNRRIVMERKTVPTPSLFSQTVDIDLDLPGLEARPLPNMPGYAIRSAQSAIALTRDLLAAGIGSVTYRLGGGMKAAGSDAAGSYVYAPLLINSEHVEAKLDDEADLLRRHGQFYDALRDAFPRGTLHIIADPFGLAPNLSDGAWGSRGENGEIDFARTAELLEAIAITYGRADVDAVLTMGRIEGEIEITRAALASIGARTKIYAFAQNVESKSAYVYLEKLGKADSLQKIIPGNIDEMKVRTILDIAAGADTTVVKPSDNLHVIQFTSDFVREPDAAIRFLSRTLETDLYDDRPDIRKTAEAIVGEPAAFFEQAARVTVGTYTVSGSYFMDKLLERDKGEAFLFSVQDERYSNIASIIGDLGAFIIDRGAAGYAKSLAKRGGRQA